MKLSAAIKELGNSAEKIGEIVNVIDDIAEQTNLLSLNAAIEAARAGDAGKGFAVVADAIRQLSEKSGEATKDIAKLINGIQDEVRGAVEVTDDSTINVKKGVEFVKSTGSAFQEIFKAINKTSSLIQEIATSIEQQEEDSKDIITAIGKMQDILYQLSATTQEQAAGSDEIVKSVLKINDLMQQMSATTEEQAASSQEVVKLVEGINKGAGDVSTGSEEIVAATSHLTEQSQELMKLVNQFKV